jgi:hypothetical protein
VVEMVYEPTLTQGEIDYKKETVKLSFQASFRGVQTTICAIFTDLQKGLMATNRNGMYVKGGYSSYPDRWSDKGADGKPGWGIVIDDSRSYNRAYQVKTALLNDHGEIIAVNDSSVGVMIEPAYNRNAQMIWESHILLEDRGSDERSSIYTALSKKIEFEVKEADITDTISIKILEVSEYRLTRSYDYWRSYSGRYVWLDGKKPIRSGQDIIPVRTGVDVGDKTSSLRFHW